MDVESFHLDVVLQRVRVYGMPDQRANMSLSRPTSYGYSLNMVCENSCPGTSVSSDVGQSSAAPVSSAAPNKNHLIEASLFGRLDQMLVPAYGRPNSAEKRSI